jgi:hypothetical protein
MTTTRRPNPGCRLVVRRTTFRRRQSTAPRDSGPLLRVAKLARPRRP